MHIEIVKKIRSLREEKNITIQEMANLLNIDLITYNTLESGKTYVWTNYLKEILKILEISENDFFDNVNPKINIHNAHGSFGSNNLHIVNMYPENIENNIRIDKIHESRIKDKDHYISLLHKEIEILKKLI